MQVSSLNAGPKAGIGATKPARLFLASGTVCRDVARSAALTPCRATFDHREHLFNDDWQRHGERA